MRMRLRLRHLWEVLTSGYWFVPATMMAGAAAMAFLLLFIDRAIIGTDARLGWVYGGGSDGAKTLLSTVASSIITIAGVVFSITIVALTQASSQFGPRLLRNFMRDTSNQVVLGTFTGTFLYCLLVLRTIHGKIQDGHEFIPQLSVTVAVLMAVASIAVLIYFIHHVSTSLQAPSIIAAVKADLESTIDRMLKDARGSCEPVEAGSGVAGRLSDDDAHAVHAEFEGYIQAIDYGQLIELAQKHDVLLRIEYQPGDYVIEHSVMARLWPAKRYDASMDGHINGAFISGIHPTDEQDIGFSVRQLAEIAVRALSPGINDPYTAVNCIDALGAILCRLSHRGLPGTLRYDVAGNLRLIVGALRCQDMMEIAFNPIRSYGKDSVAVMVRLLEVMTVCAEQMTCRQQRQCLDQHVQSVLRQSESSIGDAHDRQIIEQQWSRAVRALEMGAAGIAQHH